MTDPARAERLWLAVATVWVVSMGGEVDANVPVSSLAAQTETHVARRNASGCPRPRILSCFACGLLAIVGALIRGEGLLFGRFHPEPWPASQACSPQGDEEVQKGYDQVGDDFVKKTYY
jgi:hypothetical protein